MDYISKSYRLDEQVIDAIESAKAGGTSPNKFLRALLGFDGGPEVRPVRLSREPVLPTPIPVIDNRPKNCYCKHCGSRFAGPKYSQICGECKGSGHTLQPAECPRCTEASAL